MERIAAVRKSSWIALTLCASFAVSRAAGQAPVAPAAAAPQSSDPAVQALLDTNPQTPTDLFNVIRLLLDIGGAQPAKPLLDKLLETATDEAQLADIGRKYGASALERVATAPELQPAGKQLVDKINAAVQRQDRDPQRIATLIGRLQDPSYDVRLAAMLALRGGRDASATALVDVLLDPARAAEHPMIRTALASLEGDAVGPLTALASSPDAATRAAAIQTLGQMRDRGARAPLYAAAFSPRSTAEERRAAEAGIVRIEKVLPKPIEAAAELYLDARRAYLTRPPVAASGAEPTTAVWQWNPEAKKPVAVQAPARVAALDRAAQLAKVAAEIAGNDRFASLLSRAAALESALLAAGPDVAARQAAAKAWADAVKPTQIDLEALLDFTIEHEHPLAAAEAVRLLASRAGLKALQSPIADGRPSIMVKAAAHPDRRVRFAAVEAILALDSNAPFAGSSAVGNDVAYFASSIGARKAMVVDVSPARARDIGGVLAGLGYQADSATTAREAMPRLENDPDYELVLMYRPLSTSENGQLLAQMRAGYRTARIPAAVYCDPADVERTRSNLVRDRYTAVIYQPRTPEMLTSQLATLDEARASAVVPADERTAQARAALGAMRRLLDANDKLWDLRPVAERLSASVWSPAVGREAVAVLGLLGSPQAQRTLADVASAAVQPLELRQAASHAFCRSVVRHGTLLTTAEVIRQYDRYNASETLDRPTQQLLGAMLDAIEARAAKIPVGTTGKVSADANRP